MKILGINSKVTLAGKAATVANITTKGLTLQPSKKGCDSLELTFKDAEEFLFGSLCANGLHYMEVVEA